MINDKYVELVRTAPDCLPISILDEPFQDSDDFLWATTTPDDRELVIHFANLFDDVGDAAFVCNLSSAGAAERNLARSLVRHLEHYRQLAEREGDWVANLEETQARLSAAQAELAKVRARAAELEQENTVLKKTIFGTSSEKNPASGDSTGQEPAPGHCEPGRKPIPLRSVTGAGRKPLPASLPRDTVEYDVPAQERACPCCHGALHHIGEDVSEQLIVIPARYRVRRRVRHKYACLACGQIVSADMPRSMIPGGTYSSAEFLAHVATSRFQYGLPYFRLEAMLQQAGLNITRTTLADAMITCSERLSPMMSVLQSELLSQSIVHADETTMQVLRERDRAATLKSYLWLYRSCDSAPRQVVLFDYQETRAGEHPRKFLAPDDKHKFKGYLQVDGYSGYNQIPAVIRVGCMAHVRRKFVSALEVLPQDSRVGTEAARVLEWIGKLYAIEQNLKNQPARERWRTRQVESRPILDELNTWLRQMQDKVLPKSLLGKAVDYAVDQWPHISRYIEDGRLAIDNNIAEREIKQVVIGRKNWLFANSPEGAHANAVFYSLVRTAVANGLDPYDYLMYVFESLPAMRTAAEVEILAPWNCQALREERRHVA